MTAWVRKATIVNWLYKSNQLSDVLAVLNHPTNRDIDLALQSAIVVASTSKGLARERAHDLIASLVRNHKLEHLIFKLIKWTLTARRVNAIRIEGELFDVGDVIMYRPPVPGEEVELFYIDDGTKIDKLLRVIPLKA